MKKGPLRVAIIGQHGAGKTTLARDLSNEYSLQVISTGDLLKERAKVDVGVRGGS